MNCARVHVSDQLTAALVGREGSRYLSPPQSERDARALIALLLGRPACEGQGPWRQPVAGGQRLVELEPEP